MGVTEQRVKEAFQRGYYVTKDGKVFGPRKQISIKLHGKQRYPTISTNWGGKVYGIPAHYLAAYCFYGDKVFDQSLVVRHLDANTLNLSKENLCLGTHSDNNLDKPSSARKDAAIKARKAQETIPNNAKLTKEQVLYIYNKMKSVKGKKPNGFVKQLCDKFQVSKTVINKIERKEYYASYLD